MAYLHGDRQYADYGSPKVFPLQQAVPSRNTLRLEGFARLVDLALNDSVFMLEVIAFHVADQETQRLLCLVMLALFAVKDCRPATHEQIKLKELWE